MAEIQEVQFTEEEVKQIRNLFPGTLYEKFVRLIAGIVVGSNMLAAKIREVIRLDVRALLDAEYVGKLTPTMAMFDELKETVESLKRGLEAAEKPGAPAAAPTALLSLNVNLDEAESESEVATPDTGPQISKDTPLAAAEPTPEPTAKVSAATPAAEEPESKTIVATGGKDLNTLLGMVQSSKDEWEAKKAAVRDSFEEALNEESLLIIGKFYDPDARGGRGWSQSHYWWLIYRLANLDEPTIQNEAGAIRYAREHHSEDDPWVKDCEVKPSVYKIIKAIAKADGRYVKPGVIFQGEKINPFLLIANDVEAGKETYESGYKKVRAAGWTGIDQDVEAEELYGSEDKIEAMREYRGGGSVSHASARHRADSGDKPDNTVGSLARVTNGKPVKKGGRRS